MILLFLSWGRGKRETDSGGEGAGAANEAMLSHRQMSRNRLEQDTKKGYSLYKTPNNTPVKV